MLNQRMVSDDDLEPRSIKVAVTDPVKVSISDVEQGCPFVDGQSVRPVDLIRSSEDRLNVRSVHVRPTDARVRGGPVRPEHVPRTEGTLQAHFSKHNIHM